MAINVFTASGNCGNDFDLRFTPNNKAIGSFSLPVKQGWGDNQKTSWVTCKMFGDRAQKLAEHITKGMKLTVTGEFVLEEWENQGTKHSRPVIIVNSIDFGSSPNQQQSNQSGYQQGNRQAGNGQNNRTSQQPQNGQQGGMAEPDFDFDSDIPFAPLFKQYRAMHYAI